MTEDKGEPKTPKQGSRAEKKNAAALSAALRANLQRRKARERKLKEARQGETAPIGSDEGAARISEEAKWTK